MRKALTILLCLGFAGAVSANTMIIPFFNDGGTNFDADPPSGIAGFIGVKNLEDSTIVCFVWYTDAAGNDATPTPNSFPLGPYASATERPVADDASSEDQVMPDAVGISAGGCQITSTGRIVGNINQIYVDFGWTASAYPGFIVSE